MLNQGLPTENVTQQVIQRMNQMSLISDNFLQMNIQFSSPKFNVERDTAAFAADSLGAQIGGVLSLWLGVTVIFIFEVCEFVIVLIIASYERKKIKPPNTPPTSPDQTQL